MVENSCGAGGLDTPPRLAARGLLDQRGLRGKLPVNNDGMSHLFVRVLVFLLPTTLRHPTDKNGHAVQGVHIWPKRSSELSTPVTEPYPRV